MASYKSAAYRTGTFWAVKSVMNYRDPHRASWHEDVVDLKDECWQDLTTSAFHVALASKHALRFRAVRSVSRARELIAVSDWVLVQSEDWSVIGRVLDVVQVEMSSADSLGMTSAVRLWLDCCHEPRLGQHGELWAPKPDRSKCMLVEYEHTHVQTVERASYASHDVYTL